MGRIGSLRRGNLLLLGAPAALAAMADWFFYDHAVGWTAGAFAAALATLIAVRGGGNCLRSRAGKVVTLALLGLIGAMVEEPEGLTVLLAAIGIAMLAVVSRSPSERAPRGAAEWCGRVTAAAAFAPFAALVDGRIVARWRRRHPVGPCNASRGCLAWILPLLLSAGFVGLFALANPVVDLWLRRAASQAQRWAEQWQTLLDTARIAFWVAVVAAVYGLLRVRRFGPGEPQPDTRTPVFTADPGILRDGVTAFVSRCLLAFNAVFAGQNALDGIYLLGGATLPEGMSYAQYAHRGAYPLVATALLAALFVLVAFRPGGVAERSHLARRLVFLWLAQNVLLTVSAAWRLYLYVDACSLTRLRFAAALWMLLVAAGLVWVVMRIALRRDNRWLLDRASLSAVVVLYGCCFANVDGLIADFNVRYCLEAGGNGPEIDVQYLHVLGRDAIPALARIAPVLPDPTRRNLAANALAQLRADVNRELSDWRGWTFRRRRLAHEASADAAQ